jgi:predicted HTH domain antitoxin
LTPRYNSWAGLRRRLKEVNKVSGKRFEVELPEEVLAGFGWQEAEVPSRVRQILVMELLRQHLISQGKAVELLEISRWDLYDLMGRYRVPVIDMTPQEMKGELAQEIR